MVVIDRRFPGFQDRHPQYDEVPGISYPVANQDGPIEHQQGQLFHQSNFPGGVSPARRARVDAAIGDRHVGTPQQRERLVDNIARTTVPVEHLQGLTFNTTRGGARGGFYRRGGVPTQLNDKSLRYPGTSYTKGSSTPATLAHEIGHHVDLGLNPEHAEKRRAKNYETHAADADLAIQRKKAADWHRDPEQIESMAQENAAKRTEFGESVRVGQNEGAADAYRAMHYPDRTHEYSPHGLANNIRNNTTRTWTSSYGRRVTDREGSSATAPGLRMAEDIYLGERGRYGQLPQNLDHPHWSSRGNDRSWFSAVQRNAPSEPTAEQGQLFHSGSPWEPMYRVRAKYARGWVDVHTGQDGDRAREIAAQHINAGRHVNLDFAESGDTTNPSTEWHGVNQYAARRKGESKIRPEELD